MQRLVAASAFVCVAAAALAAQGSMAPAVYRYRAAIAALLQLKPGMVVAEVGSTPAVLASELTPLVGTTGRVISAAFDRASGAIDIAPASADAVALIEVFGVTDRHKDVVDRAAAALKPGGVLLVVDVPQENDGRKVVGIEADEVVKLAAAAGLKREAESGIVPGHYSIRFRKP
jgi:predicted methyltransferase